MRLFSGILYLALIACGFIFLIDLNAIGLTYRLVASGGTMISALAFLLSMKASVVTEGEPATISAAYPLGILATFFAASAIWIYHPEVSALKAQHAYQNGDDEQAISLLTHTINSELTPEKRKPSLSLERSTIKLFFARDQGLDDSYFVSILQEMSPFAEHFNDRPSFFYNRARVFVALGAFEEALSDHKRAIDVAKDAEHSYLRRAATYRVLGEFEKSLADIESAMAIAGDRSGDARFYHHGKTLWAMGQYQEASDAFTRAIQKDDDYSWSYIYRGCTFAHLADFNTALRDFETGIALYESYLPDNWESSPRYSTDMTVIKNAISALTTHKNSEQDPSQETSGFCRQFWTFGRTLRERSSLLSPPLNDL